MKTSESLGAIAKAVIAFESEMESVKKGKKAHHSMYADLPSILMALKPLLKKHGLGVIQSVHNVGDMVGLIDVKTRLIHESGEWVETSCPICISKNDPQASGSAITYGRRYGLQATLNLSAEDDDAESGMQRPTAPPSGDKGKGKTHNVQHVDDII